MSAATTRTTGLRRDPPIAADSTSGRHDALDAALGRILPTSAVGRVATGDMWEAELPAVEVTHVRDAVPDRRREFAAGRTAARAALSELGRPDVLLPADEDRVPEWPEGVAGSISHCEDLCVAAVTDDDATLGLGLDVEPAAPLESRLVSLVCTPREREWARRAMTGLTPGLLFKVVFTAKEAVYKCCYPRTRRELEFDQVEVTPHPPAGAFEAEIAAAGRGPEGSSLPRRLAGRFTLVGGFVLTAVAWKDG